MMIISPRFDIGGSAGGVEGGICLLERFVWSRNWNAEGKSIRTSEPMDVKKRLEDGQLERVR